MYWMIGAKVPVNGVEMFRVMAVVTNHAAALETMADLAALYHSVARRVATAQEFAAFSNGAELEFTTYDCHSDVDPGL